MEKQAQASTAMTQKEIQTFFELLRHLRPHPTTELNYTSTFELLIAVMLSAQATDKSVNKATDKLFPVANTAQQIYDLGLEGLKYYIKSIGLFNSKAEHIIKTCQILIQNYQGNVPNTREALEQLPGVGRKTANVILNTAFGQVAMAVDTHIFRLSNRTGLAIGKNVRQVEKKLLEVIPQEFILDAHHWLILHGRYCCTARQPQCSHCVVKHVCHYTDKNL